MRLLASAVLRPLRSRAADSRLITSDSGSDLRREASDEERRKICQRARRIMPGGNAKDEVR
eukprot:3297437-Rhodomonas_salina.1